MISLFKLRQKEPLLLRPFRVPAYPYFPLLALAIASFSFVAMAVYNVGLVLIYFGILALSFIIYKLKKKK
jgi:ethanolamine permease